jgi:hypothetical protein
MRDMCDTLSSLLFPPPPPPFHLNSPPTHACRQGWSPSSLLRDVGPNQNVRTDPGASTLPLPEVCATPPLFKRLWASPMADLAVEEHKGGPIQCVEKVGYDICRGLFLFHPNEQPRRRGREPDDENLTTRTRRQREPDDNENLTTTRTRRQREPDNENPMTRARPGR